MINCGKHCGSCHVCRLNCPVVLALVLMLTISSPAQSKHLITKSIEKTYDYLVAKKRAHPKVWKASVFATHVAIGTMQVATSFIK